jgi:AraC family transcriptional regulator of adaptative response/methylated-DNA-[protein]-cysteine methyltransferase
MKKKLPSKNIMYNAVLKKDAGFVGIFYVAVKSTGIFCKPTCTARKPKPENVEFFSTTGEAIESGYRPCKLCRPMNLNGTKPDWVENLFKRILSSPNERWKDADLKKLGFEPNRVRRWFKRNYNTTFISYLRSIRLAQAVNKIGKGKKIMETAYTTGFESLSGFADALKNLTGKSPAQTKDIKILSVGKIDTPLGEMIAGTIDDKLCMLEFEDRRMLKTQIKRITKMHGAIPIIQNHPLFKKVDEEISLYFESKLKNFSIPLIESGTDFQLSVWSELKKIPYGETISYEKLAQRIGNVNAVRAVASANGFNSIAIIIPCHRVIGKDGNLRGYGGKVWRKKKLLEIESPQIKM